MRNSTLDVRPAFGPLGAVIHGVDLSKPVEEREYRDIRSALNEHCLLFFKHQTITPAQHLAFGKLFGEIWVSPALGKVPGHPQVVEIRREPEDTHDHGGNWHSDQTYTELPLFGSILLAHELPASGGGDTMFANLCRAYDTLSDGLKKTLLGLRAVHTLGKRIAAVGIREPDQGMSEADKKREATHPVVVRHPESGRNVLYVNPTYTVRFEGWTEEESKPLLDVLFRHASRPENTCRFHWEPGDIAFWDNRSCWHFAVQDYAGERRVMHRVSIQGSIPIQAQA